MNNKDTALYSPYGAYAMKHLYQRNFLYGTLSVLLLVVIIVATAYIISAMQTEDEFANAPVAVIKTIAELGPPPAIAKKPPQVKVEQVNVAAPKVGIPKPVADEEVLDDDVVLATREELADIVYDPTSEMEGDGEIVVDIDESEYLPEAGEFVPVEISAEMISEVAPEYPSLLRNAGIEGVVWVQALVDKDGTVRRAQVARTSGVEGLDEAAVDAAYKNKYKPGIQNGRPVAMWVTYKVDFKVER